MEPDTANNLSPEVIAAIISAGGAIASAVIAWVSAQFVAKREIRKMQLSWKREDDTLHQKLFADMSVAVSRYIQSGWSRHQREAAEAISLFQSTSPEMAPEIATLYDAVLDGQIERCKTSLVKVICLHQQVTAQQQGHCTAKSKQTTN